MKTTKTVVGDALAILGFPVKDRVTGMDGVVTSVGFDLYGCVQCIVSPGIDKDGKMKDSLWFDINRLEVKGKSPKMPNPFVDTVPAKSGVAHAFGPADKPSRMP